MGPAKLNSYVLSLTRFTQISFHIHESMDSSQRQAKIMYLRSKLQSTDQYQITMPSQSQAENES